jgi:hypothetical protein
MHGDGSVFREVKETCRVTCVQMIMYYSVDTFLCVVGKVICPVGAFPECSYTVLPHSACRELDVGWDDAVR